MRMICLLKYRGFFYFKKPNKMAEFNKDVVERMLGKSFASMLGLATKWLDEWKIELDKLLHSLHQIRKEDLIGLVTGTHQIRKKEWDVPGEQNDDGRYECIFEAEITIPDMELVNKLARQDWGNDMINITPSTVYETGTIRKIRLYRVKIGSSSDRIIEFIIRNKQLLPNIFGLKIAEMTIFSELPRDEHHPIIGFDYRDNLPVTENSVICLPNMELNVDESIQRSRYIWGGSWKNNYFVTFE